MNLDEIKQYLTEKNYDAVLITRNNHFLGQDVLETENRILALTGFSGSAGTLVVSVPAAGIVPIGTRRPDGPTRRTPLSPTAGTHCGSRDIHTNTTSPGVP